VQSVTYSKWIKHYKDISGFNDFADFSTCRESRLRHGILVKPDTTNGSYIIPSLKIRSELQLIEKQGWYVGNFKLPKVPSPDFQDPHWFRRSHYNRHRRECSVVAVCDNLVVIQVNTNRYYLSPRFYILDRERGEVVGHFLTFYHCRRWYECYISPNKNVILLRPDNLTRIVSLPDNCLLENVTMETDDVNINVQVIPPTLRSHVLTFNRHLGDHSVLVAFHTNIDVKQIATWETVQSVQNLDLPASIQQIKSSPSGDFIAVRCVQPVHSKEYNVNMVAVLSFHTFNILFKVDARGCYWPVSEVVNLQVFPHFSPSESSIAIMKNGTYNRKVMTFKLPIAQLNLQCLYNLARNRSVYAIFPLLRSGSLSDVTDGAEQTCIITFSTENKAFIRIDLGQVYTIRNVSFVFRQDHIHRITPFRIYLSSQFLSPESNLCYRYTDTTQLPPQPGTFPCPATGRYLSITSTRDDDIPSAWRPDEEFATMSFCDISVEGTVVTTESVVTMVTGSTSSTASTISGIDTSSSTGSSSGNGNQQQRLLLGAESVGTGPIVAIILISLCLIAVFGLIAYLGMSTKSIIQKSETEGIQNQDKTGTKANKQKPPPYEKKRTPDMGVRPGAQEE
ncbi:hypothetical protein FSP39_019252, partial [Pinctada imbricata]